MRTTATKWAAKAAGTGVVALLLATPAFAQSRSDWNRNNNSNRGAQETQTRADNNRQYQRSNQPQYQAPYQAQNQTAVRSQREFHNNDYRGENQRVTESARITSFARERDGYRVGLDRGRSYWVPESRAHGLRVGLSINLGSLFGYPAGYAYDNGYVRGVINRVDYRTGTVWLRDEQSGAEIRAAVGGYALGDLHRGEFVELTGRWIDGGIGGGVFDVARIASIR